MYIVFVRNKMIAIHKITSKISTNLNLDKINCLISCIFFLNKRARPKFNLLLLSFYKQFQDTFCF